MPANVQEMWHAAHPPAVPAADVAPTIEIDAPAAAPPATFPTPAPALPSFVDSDPADHSMTAPTPPNPTTPSPEPAAIPIYDGPGSLTDSPAGNAPEGASPATGASGVTAANGGADPLADVVTSDPNDAPAEPLVELGYGRPYALEPSEQPADDEDGAVLLGGPGDAPPHEGSDHGLWSGTEDAPGVRTDAAEGGGGTGAGDHPRGDNPDSGGHAYAGEHQNAESEGAAHHAGDVVGHPDQDALSSAPNKVGGIALGTRAPTPEQGDETVTPYAARHSIDTTILTQGGENPSGEAVQNCNLVSVLNGILKARPEYLQGMEEDLGNGFYKVTLYDLQGTPRDVLVTDNTYTDPSYATPSGPPELRRLHAALAVLGEPAWTDGNLVKDSVVSYADYASRTMTALGLEMTDGSTLDGPTEPYQVRVRDAVEMFSERGGIENGNIAILGTRDAQTLREVGLGVDDLFARGLAAGHAYLLDKIDAKGAHLRDPQAGIDSAEWGGLIKNPAPIPLPMLHQYFGTAFYGVVPGNP
jgi:hypothetical protein